MSLQQIRHHLDQIYSQGDATSAYNGIVGLIEKYQDIPQSTFSLSQKDVAMIVYGDQVEGHTSKLATLREVLQRQLAGSLSIVHILPFYPYSSDDGFSVEDYYAVRDDIGEWSDVEDCSQSFHLMFDGVINHMSAGSAWFRKYLQGAPGFETFFFEGSDFEGLDKVVRPRTSPLHHDFDGKRVWTTFSEDQVDLNYADPRVLLQILDVLLFYVSKGASLLRLDAIGFLWKKENTTCIHLEETHRVIKLMRLVIESVAPQVLLITETNVPHEENISYFGEGDEAHLVYNFTLPPMVAFSILNGTSEKLTAWASALSLDHNRTCFFNFLSSHDGVGLRPVTGILDDTEIGTLLQAAAAAGGRVSYRAAGGEKKPYEINCNYFSLLQGAADDDLALKRMILAHAILLAFPGLPAIYFHSFFGMRNDLEGLEAKGYPRAINREKFTLAQLEAPLSDDTSIQSQVLGALKALIEVRKQQPQFHPYGGFEFPKTEKGVFSIVRYDAEKEPVCCHFNLTDEEVLLAIHETPVDLLTGKSYESSVPLPALGFVWLRRS